MVQEAKALHGLPGQLSRRIPAAGEKLFDDFTVSDSLGNPLGIHFLFKMAQRPLHGLAFRFPRSP